MARALLRGTLSLVLTLLAASVIIFGAMQLLPGDPAEVMLGVNARPDTLAALRAEWGLDQPVAQRYADWLAGFAVGNLGQSLTYASPVAQLVGERLVVTGPLAVLSLVLTLLLALPAGMYAAAHRGRGGDSGMLAVTQLGIAIPNFWLAMLLVLVFAMTWRILPAGGFPGWDAGVGAGLHALALPAVALAVPQACILARVTRTALIDVLEQDFIRTARAMGLSHGAVLRRHALRNAMIPVLVIVGLQFPFLISGAIIVENVFFLPGLGRLLFQAVNQRDFMVVQSVVMLLVALVILVNFTVNAASFLIDPRLRRQS